MYQLVQAFDEKIWQMNRSAIRLLIVSANLDDFSLANHRRFTKLPPTKLSCYAVSTKVKGSAMEMGALISF